MLVDNIKKTNISRTKQLLKGLILRDLKLSRQTYHNSNISPQNHAQMNLVSVHVAATMMINLFSS